MLIISPRHIIPTCQNISFVSLSLSHTQTHLPSLSFSRSLFLSFSLTHKHKHKHTLPLLLYLPFSLSPASKFWSISHKTHNSLRLQILAKFGTIFMNGRFRTALITHARTLVAKSESMNTIRWRTVSLCYNRVYHLHCQLCNWLTIVYYCHTTKLLCCKCRSNHSRQVGLITIIKIPLH